MIFKSRIQNDKAEYKKKQKLSAISSSFGALSAPSSTQPNTPLGGDNTDVNVDVDSDLQPLSKRQSQKSSKIEYNKAIDDEIKLQKDSKKQATQKRKSKAQHAEIAKGDLLDFTDILENDDEDTKPPAKRQRVEAVEEQADVIEEESGAVGDDEEMLACIEELKRHEWVQTTVRLTATITLAGCARQAT